MAIFTSYVEKPNVHIIIHCSTRPIEQCSKALLPDEYRGFYPIRNGDFSSIQEWETQYITVVE